MNSKITEFFFTSIRSFTTIASVVKQFQNPEISKALIGLGSVAGALASIISFQSILYQRYKLEKQHQQHVNTIEIQNKKLEEKGQELEKQIQFFEQMNRIKSKSNLSFYVMYVSLCFTAFFMFYIFGRRKASRIAFDYWVSQSSIKSNKLIKSSQQI